MPTVTLAARAVKAVLESAGDPLEEAMIRVPLDVAKVWGARGQLKVECEINGFTFRTSLFPTGKGGHILMVNKKMQSGGRTAPGMSAHFRLEPDTEPRVVAEPAELKRAWRESKPVEKYYQSLNYSTRREIAK